MSRDKIDIPEPLESKIRARFGDAANTWTGVLVAALWYAVERYDAEHGPPPEGDGS